MTSTYVLYAEINSLSEFAFIAGTPYTLNFNVYEDNGVTPLDMGGGTFRWVLSPYGKNYNVLEVEGTITGIGTAVVELETSHTENLAGGKYTHQPVIISFTNEEYRPAQGILLLIPRTPLA